MGLKFQNESLPVNRDGSNRNKTNLNINANEVVSSPDVNITRGSIGTQIQFQPSYLGSGIIYCNTFVYGNPYQLDQIVKITGSLDWDSSGSLSPIGNWICESPIPGFRNRLPGIKYAPILPEPLTLAHQVSSSAQQGRYWHCISLGPVTMSMCDPNTGLQSTFWVNASPV